CRSDARERRGDPPARVPGGRHENGAVTEPGHRRRVAIREGVRGLPPLPTPPSPPAPTHHPAGHPPQSSRPPAPLALAVAGRGVEDGEAVTPATGWDRHGPDGTPGPGGLSGPRSRSIGPTGWIRARGRPWPRW